MIYEGFEIIDPDGYGRGNGTKKKVGSIYIKDPQGNEVRTEGGSRKLFQYRNINKKLKTDAMEKAQAFVDELIKNQAEAN